MPDRLASLDQFVSSVLPAAVSDDVDAGALLPALLDALPTRVAVVDRHGVVIAVNHAWRNVELHNPGLSVGVGDNAIAVWTAGHGEGAQRARRTANYLRHVLTSGTEMNDPDMVQDVARVGSGDDRWFRSRILPVPEPIGGALIMHVDVTGDVAAQLASERGATHDPLTALPNRALLLDRLDQAMLRRRSGALAVLVVDVDAFTTVNDSMGSDVGDTALVSVARRIGECLRGDEWMARFDGDSFVVVLDGYRPDHILLQLAERIRDHVAEPIMLAGTEVILTAAVGLALSGGPDQPSIELLREAEEAAQRANASGRGQIELADGKVRIRAQSRLDTEQALRRAIVNSELRLVYQAEVSLDSGRVIGAEALLRWHRDGGPPLQPEEFVRMAEDTGLIVPIGDWVLYEACRAAAQWPVVDGDGLFVAVNLSARQLVSPVLVEMVRMALRATGLPASRLCIELTESAVLSSFDIATDVLAQLRDMGVLVALDDFGTGYSSLSYLRRIPVDIVKLDRSFVEQIETDPVARAIVGAVLSLAQSLGLTVVAEGVESETQRERLRELGCDVVQGFSLGRPTEEAEFIDLAVASRAAVQAWRS